MPASVAPGRLTYEDWAARLCDHFFSAEFDGVPVMLFVNDAAVGLIYSGDSSEAVASLVAGVRERLRLGQPRRLFGRIESEARRWRIAGGDGPPPFLPLLAVTVLAATRMGRRRDRAAHNYYKPFRELLALEVEIGELQASSGDALPYLWQALQWWLDDKLRGRLGFSTIVAGYFTYDWADSQTLFNNSDRDRLTQFFRWIGLKPGESIEQSELMTYFRIWASRRADLSEGAAHMLESEDYSTQLAQIVKAAADRWRGVVRDEGRRAAEIVVTLELFPRPRLGLSPERPDGFPAELACQNQLGQAVTLTSSYKGWYDELQITVTTAVLDTGLRFAGDGVQVRLRSYNVHVLEKNAELGKWSSVAQLSPGEPAWLLVRYSALLDVTTYLQGTAREGWRLIEREGLAPRGWSLIGDVLIDAATDDLVPEQLARIVPRVQNRFSFKGGLPLPRGSATYLLGGEPDLWLPPPSGEDRAVELKLDEEHLCLPPSTTHVRLADREARGRPPHRRARGHRALVLHSANAWADRAARGPAHRPSGRSWRGRDGGEERRRADGRAAARPWRSPSHRSSRRRSGRRTRRAPAAPTHLANWRAATDRDWRAPGRGRGGPGPIKAAVDGPCKPWLSSVRACSSLRRRLGNHLLEPRAHRPCAPQAAAPARPARPRGFR